MNSWGFSIGIDFGSLPSSTHIQLCFILCLGTGGLHYCKTNDVSWLRHGDMT